MIDDFTDCMGDTEATTITQNMEDDLMISWEWDADICPVTHDDSKQIITIVTKSTSKHGTPEEDDRLKDTDNFDI
jgi:hypothetical protein